MEVRTMTNAKRKSLVSILVFSLLLPAVFAIAPQTAFGITLLHEFAGYHGGDGGYPYGSLTLSGSTLYGMTKRGGGHHCGVVFKVDTDGGGYDRLHEFAGRGDAGRYPLVLWLVSSVTYFWPLGFKPRADLVLLAVFCLRVCQGCVSGLLW